MALTLNGSTGISGIAGSAGTPALQGNNDANTGYFFAADTLGLSTAGSERLKVTSAGLISIGDNTNLDSQLTITQSVGDCIRLRTSASNNTYKYGIIKLEPYNNNALGVQIVGAKSDSGYTEVDLGGGIDGGYAATQLDFWTAANTTTATGSRRLRITSTGIIQCGTAATLKAEINNAVSGHQFISQCDDNNNGFEIYQQHGSTATRNTLAVYDNRGNSAAKQLAFAVIGDGNVKIQDGDLVIGTAGHGIDFSAQTATSETGASNDDELFNHYEEGDWTPTPVITYQGGTGALSAIQDQYGRYVRSGRYVQVWFYVKFTAANITNCNVGLNGLPFTISNDAQWNSGFNGGIARRGVTGGETYVCEGMGKNGTQIQVLRKYNNYGFTDTTQSIGGEACYLVD